jgi:hypothetical protein
MKLTSLSNVNASSQEEYHAASIFLQSASASAAGEESLSTATRALLSFLKNLRPSWAREIAVEVLLSC